MASSHAVEALQGLRCSGMTVIAAKDSGNEDDTLLPALRRVNRSAALLKSTPTVSPRLKCLLRKGAPLGAGVEGRNSSL